MGPRDEVAIDILIIAGNARSLIANRGDLIGEMIQRGYRVGAAVPRYDYLPEVKDLGIEIFPFDMARTGTNPRADLKTLRQLIALVRAIRPATIFSYTIKPVIYGSIAASLAGGNRRFAMITGLGHTYTTRSFKNAALQRLTDKMYRLALSTCERVFFQNPDDLTEFQDRRILRDGARAVRVNGSGVNLERFPLHKHQPGRPEFLFIGRLLEEKGIREFVEAAARLKSSWPDAQFTVVGGHDPNLPHSVSSAELDSWKTEGSVKFVGQVADVRPWLQRCSVLVLPSYREGTPRAVLEAMATGRAIITTDAPGCRETVDHGVNGLLVPPGDSSALQRAMEELLESPHRISEMGDASRQLVESKYDVRLVNANILDAMGLDATDVLAS